MKNTIRFAVAAALAMPLVAQAQAWKQGMPDKMKDSKLAPHAGKMTETPPSEIPVTQSRNPQNGIAGAACGCRASCFRAAC